jgi:predicted permease
MLLAFPIAKLFRMNLQKKRTLFLILPFGNIAFLGIPVLNNAFGKEILPIAAIISAIYVFWMLTLAVILIEFYGETRTKPKKLFLSLLQNPLLLSVFIGLAIVWFNIELPDFLSKTINLFADSVTAIVLFSLGIFLGMQKIGNIKEWSQVTAYSLLTMIVLPALLYGFVLLFNTDTPHLKAIIIDAAMPLGITPYVLSAQYKLESALVARVVVLATLLSVIIIPLWMVILQ